ncbi:DNA-cytosine methyltransferase [Methylocella silvestris BL2]|uniref:DNA (cytosine-5-)-methyltransferase n=1 Tax=Methylocella silvestris (strain DSM 15510 / CIP 108128 / LMG 27833 / NCIMB 13906 / BL2) TaxID=395965 RepID=B8ELD0_METSB|nr:DNA cytosine methyltransferase [Methylocella silvestris]ACK49519.1 DNA-cytosine methyltransferase [Methylocella silvestris BL2]
MPDFLEFFAGGGMARAGLGPNWTCRFANDFDARKCASYRANWGAGELFEADVGALQPADIKTPRANLAWASFPCQDLSLAGARAGLGGARSGSFYPFWSLIEKLARERRAPDLIVLENVKGALTSHGGADFTALCACLSRAGYAFGAVIVDAALFAPQSRPRLFVIGVREHLRLPQCLAAAAPSGWHPPAVRQAHAALPPALQRRFIWLSMPEPAPQAARLKDILEDDGEVRWRSDAETDALLSLMNETNRQRLAAARGAAEGGAPVVGCAYRRTRLEADGVRRQRAEARFDGLAGCLRTPSGGSSRQFILAVEKQRVRSRLITARETARLMGLPDSYILPQNYNDAYHLTGDGLAVPVVRHIAQHILEPILAHQAQPAEAAE